MNKKFKIALLAIIIISFISIIIPVISIISFIIGLFIYFSIKKQEFQILKINNLSKELDELNKLIHTTTDELNVLKKEKEEQLLKLKELNVKIFGSEELVSINEIENEILYKRIEYIPKEYNFNLSEEYKQKLNENREKQKKYIKNYLGVQARSSMIFSSSLKETEKAKLINSLKTLILKSFCAESDLIINNLTIANMDASRKKLELSFSKINDIIKKSFHFEITLQFYKLKLQQLQLQYELMLKEKEEKEEQKLIKEHMREEAKIQAEIIKLEKEAEKEERMKRKILDTLTAELQRANEIERTKLQEQISQLQIDLKLAQEKMQRAKSMAEQTKAGFVYVISNIGSFGENIYKIGLTRRLDPMERIKELSSASVPFNFDVHALIYSEDAPQLEKELHKQFYKNRVNKVNSKKEFFKVSLSEIEQVVNEKLNVSIKFTKAAEALEYRQSLQKA